MFQVITEQPYQVGKIIYLILWVRKARLRGVKGAGPERELERAGAGCEVSSPILEPVPSSLGCSPGDVLPPPRARLLWALRGMAKVACSRGRRGGLSQLCHSMSLSRFFLIS